MYFLAGGFEFNPTAPAASPSRKRLNFLARAFGLLRHDLLYVTPAERLMLTRAGVALKPEWVGSDRLETHILQAEGGPKVAVLILPPLSADAIAVPETYIHQLENLVHKLRGTVKLIVAMSSWGYVHELELLKAKGPLPDVLLGSGPGIGLVGQLAAEGKTAWLRSFSQGKSILRLEVLAWPEHNPTFKWTEDKNIRMTLFGLTDQYQENPHMLTLMQNMGTD